MRTGRILTDERQLSQGNLDGRGQSAKLPADLLADSLRPVGGGQPSRLGSIRGGTQGVRAHMRDARGLPCRSRGGHRCRSAHLASGSMSDETPAGLSDAKLATSKRSKPGDCIHGDGYPPELPLEQPQHRSARSAAQTATIRRSASLSVYGEPTPRSSTVPAPGPSWPRLAGLTWPGVNARAVVRAGRMFSSRPMLVSPAACRFGSGYPRFGARFPLRRGD